MSEPFLEEQLKRIREMSDRVSDMRNRIRDVEKHSSADRSSPSSSHAPQRPSRRHPASRRHR